MAAKVRIEFHIPAFNAYRNSGEVTALVESLGQQVLQRAAGGVTSHEFPDEAPFRAQTVHRASRVAVYVATNSEDGRIAEAKDRALTRAVMG